MVGRARAWWAAASIALSACLYLLDLGTNISTLRTYYHYESLCPHAPLASLILRRDPICRAIRSGYTLHNIPTQFWECLTVLFVAHLTYAFIFWVSLDPHLHPFRLAYFMPLIHLYRLLKLFYHTFSCRGIKKLQEEQRECKSLYNALGASLETAPQLIIQFHIAMKLGQYIKGSLDPNMQAQIIPTNLLLSLVVSLVSETYSASMAVLLLMEEDMTLARKICLSTMIGSQTLAVIIVKTILSAAFAQFADQGFSIPLLIYILSGVMIAWPFCGFLLQTHGDYSQGKQILLKVAHSFGLALMTIVIGPIYVIVKLKTKLSFLIWGILSHIFVDLVGIAVVLLRPGNMKEREGPCHPLKVTNLEAQQNQYLTCHLFLGTIFPSLFVIFLTTILFVMFHIKGTNMERVGSKTSMDIACESEKKPSSFHLCISRNNIHSSEHFEGKKPHQESTSSIFKLLLLFVLVLLFIQKPPKLFVRHNGIASTN